MSRPPVFPEQSASGIAVDPRTLDRVVPESRRADGSWVSPRSVSCSTHAPAGSERSSKFGRGSLPRRMSRAFAGRGRSRWTPLRFQRATYWAGSHPRRRRRQSPRRVRALRPQTRMRSDAPTERRKRPRSPSKTTGRTRTRGRGRRPRLLMTRQRM